MPPEQRSRLLPIWRVAGRASLTPLQRGCLNTAADRRLCPARHCLILAANLPVVAAFSAH